MVIHFMCLCVEKFFLDVLASKSEVVSEVENFSGDIRIEKGRLVFSISALYLFLVQFSQESIGVAEFQRQLYQSTLNQDLKTHGAQIVVHHSTGKVETSLYRLERVESADSNS